MAEKKINKNSAAETKTVMVELQEAEALMTTVRWGSEQAVDGDLREELSALCERPVLQAKEIDIEKLYSFDWDLEANKNQKMNLIIEKVEIKNSKIDMYFKKNIIFIK